MARSNNTRTASRSSSRQAPEENEGNGFRMTAVYLGHREGDTQDGRPYAMIDTKDVVSVEGKPINQKLVKAFGDERIADVLPRNVRKGDMLEFFGVLTGGSILVLGPWTESSYEQRGRSAGRSQRGQSNSRSNQRSSSRSQSRSR